MDGLSSGQYSHFIPLVLKTCVDGKPNRKVWPELLKQVSIEMYGKDKEWTGRKATHMAQCLDTDEKWNIWLASRNDPLIDPFYDNDEITAIDNMVASGDLDKIVDASIAWEQENCSWEATIGPAMKAIKRLGRTAVGRDFKSLAQYAQDHQKPSL
ncbi:uncharacterized protein N7469_007661 [Penicillium citrinum]|uniref:Uncharacterized protein n=1 Tax=Penicillium citrinum TaxID=5077 RepID=A0A9W9NQR2_PENCI|nr:uncharacterized protein N7469_007661 [Penicillium citrinum]KAJ5224158.1 hypothetical protein N7469_007661 [Penicillium citrinum]